jgi:hypothetical protein
MTLAQDGVLHHLPINPINSLQGRECFQNNGRENILSFSAVKLVQAIT